MPIELVSIAGRAGNGKSRPFFCEADDGHFYFVKRDNVTRDELVMDYLISRLAEECGLPVAPVRLVTIPKELAAHALVDDPATFQAGVAFGSQRISFADEILKVTEGEGVDVVLNSLTGELLQRGLELLRSGGRFVELGLAELLSPEEVASRYPGVRYEAFQLGALPIPDDEFHAMFVEVLERFSTGQLQPIRNRVFAPDRIADAFHHMAQARHTGKVLIASAQVAEALIDGRGSYLVTGGGGGVRGIGA